MNILATHVQQRRPSVAASYDYAAQPKVGTNCPVCGAENPSLTAIDRWGYLVGLSRCACGLAYLNPRMTHDGYADFYAHHYRRLTAQFSPPASETGTAKRGRLIADALQNAGVTAVRSVLDVGGGTGVLAKTVGEAFGTSDVTVIDPNTDELAQAVGVTTIPGLVETLPPPHRRWDLILCVFTSDHWLDPLAALHWMRSALNPWGHLWIDYVMPARGGVGYLKIDHPLYWSGRALARALTSTGWARIQTFRMEGKHFWHPCVLCTGADTWQQ